MCPFVGQCTKGSHNGTCGKVPAVRLFGEGGGFIFFSGGGELVLSASFPWCSESNFPLRVRSVEEFEKFDKLTPQKVEICWIPNCLPSLDIILALVCMHILNVLRHFKKWYYTQQRLPYTIYENVIAVFTSKGSTTKPRYFLVF